MFKIICIDMPSSLNVYERLQILEKKIMQLEKEYPPWSAVHFNQNSSMSKPSVWTSVSKSKDGKILTLPGVAHDSDNPTIELFSEPPESENINVIRANEVILTSYLSLW